jgi:hypothetical protein
MLARSFTSSSIGGFILLLRTCDCLRTSYKSFVAIERASFGVTRSPEDAVVQTNQWWHTGAFLLRRKAGYGER